MERGVKRTFVEADLEDGLTEEPTFSVDQISLLYMLSENKLAMEKECHRRLQRLLHISKLSSCLKLKLTFLEEAEQLLRSPSYAEISRRAMMSASQNQKQQQDSLPDISTFMFPMAPCPPLPVPVSLSAEKVSPNPTTGYNHTHILTDLSRVGDIPNSSSMLPSHSGGLYSDTTTTTTTQSVGAASHSTSQQHVISFTSFNTNTGELTPQWLDSTSTYAV